MASKPRPLTLDQEDFLMRRIWSYLMNCGHPVSSTEITENFDALDQHSVAIHPEIDSSEEDHRVSYSRACRLLNQLVGLGYAKREFMPFGVNKAGHKVRKWFYTGIDGDWPEMQKGYINQQKNRFGGKTG
jgi:hypothetical protein